MTGADFPVVAPRERDADRPAIFVSLSEPVNALLGPEPLAKLHDQEHVARSIGSDILLYGKGHRARLDAVIDFLENSLGWRWYSPFEKPVVPKRATLKLKRFSRKRGFEFASRHLARRYNGDFFLQHGDSLSHAEECAPLDAANCRAMFCHSEWYRDLIAEHCGPANQSPIVLWPYPINPWLGELQDEYDLLIYAKKGHRPQLLEHLAEIFPLHIRIHYGRYQREELFEAARRSNACAYLADDDHGPLALQRFCWRAAQLLAFELEPR